MENPYLKQKNKPVDSKGPLIMRVPTYEFKDSVDMETSLLPNEFCMALIPNTSPTGFEKHAALVLKDAEGRVYSTGLMQHNGILQDTKENQEALHALQEQKTSDEPKEQETNPNEEARGYDFGETTPSN